MASSAPGAAEYWATPSSTLADASPETPRLDEVFNQEGMTEAYAAEPAWEPETSWADQERWTDDDEWSDEAAFSDASSEGLSGRGVVVVGAASAAACTIVDLALTAGRLTFFFDLCFVVICLVTTLAVRRRDLFTAGVLPPLLYGGLIAVLSVVAPSTITSGAGISKVFLTGLADHAFGLVSGYAVALLAVAARVASSNTRA